MTSADSGCCQRRFQTQALERDGGTPYVEAYVFDALPGVAGPVAVARAISFYAYQTEGDAPDPGERRWIDARRASSEDLLHLGCPGRRARRTSRIASLCR